MGVKKILFLFVLTAFVSSISANEIETSIGGSVVRQGNNIPLNGANVVISNKSGFTKGTATDQDGSFFFANIPSGSYTVSISFIGFQNYESDLFI